MDARFPGERREGGKEKEEERETEKEKEEREREKEKKERKRLIVSKHNSDQV